MFSYLSFRNISELAWWDLLVPSYRMGFEVEESCLFDDTQAICPWLLGQITHNEVEKELVTGSLNNLYCSSSSSVELPEALLKRTSLDGPSWQPAFGQKKFQISINVLGYLQLLGRMGRVTMIRKWFVFTWNFF